MDDGQAESKKETDQAIMDNFRTETKRLESGRYEVHLPWMEPAQKPKENKSHAEKRLRKMTEDLKKRGFCQHYNKIFEEWEENRIIERIQTVQYDTLGYFLPHRAAVKSDSSTTPVRPAFGASCKTKGGWSLNDCLAKGPNLLELIPDIMLRFRLNKISIVSDIEKAFLQISVVKEDRQYLRFLWWEDGKQENLRIYQHKRVVFGVTSSPFLLAATLKLHLEQYENEREVIPLLKCMYMDNCVNSVTSLEEAQVFQQQSIDLFSPAGFNLREWKMGGPGIVNSENISVLGMKWDTADDTLTISDKLMMTPTYKSLDQGNDAEIDNQTHKLTKRIMLSEAHAVFDPLGLFSPFTIVPKIILQQCWKSELKWDQPVPEDIAKKFVEWQSQIPEWLSVRIPRFHQGGTYEKDADCFRSVKSGSQEGYRLQSHTSFNVTCPSTRMYDDSAETGGVKSQVGAYILEDSNNTHPSQLPDPQTVLLRECQQPQVLNRVLIGWLHRHLPDRSSNLRRFLPVILLEHSASQTARPLRVAFNFSKSCGLWCGFWKHRTDSPVGFSWTSESLTVLGCKIIVGNTITSTHQASHLKGLLKRAIALWSSFTRGLFLPGMADTAGSLLLFLPRRLLILWEAASSVFELDDWVLHSIKLKTLRLRGDNRFLWRQTCWLPNTGYESGLHLWIRSTWVPPARLLQEKNSSSYHAEQEAETIFLRGSTTTLPTSLARVRA
ncbi:hypothetical protein LAZ67_2005488 [Cordylochernes scorpioides]|uniref:Reverse transcriptase n=1 Tax=Cordylochernes scorpioides TaxID=51811 RepID=A0ABY6K4E9_9ARAC|nr:hypothetical protein LAZ67_2005488 [Cordylochernes scorpioides]